MRLHLSALVLFVLFAMLAPVLAPHDPAAQDRDHAAAPPSASHWMGTDEFGRDLWSRFLIGGSWSVAIGLSATATVIAIGWTLGGLAGFLGGWVDGFVMQLAELFLVLPWMYLLVAMHAILPLGLPPRMVFAALLLTIAAVSWAQPARLVRGLVLSLVERGWVQAARGFGVPGWKVFLRHILPETLPLLVAQALLALPRFVLAEVTLSFLGLGAGEPEPSWGALIVSLKQLYLLNEQWWRILPSLLMIPFFMSFAILAHKLKDQHRTVR